MVMVLGGVGRLDVIDLLGMNDYEKVMADVKRQIDSTQKKISLYYDEAPQSNSLWMAPGPVVFTQPHPQTQTLSQPLYRYNHNNLVPEYQHPPQIPSYAPQLLIPAGYQNTQPFLNTPDTSPYHSKTKQPSHPYPSLPPITYQPPPPPPSQPLSPTSNLTLSRFEQPTPNTMRIKLAQASILKNQLQINKLNKQKQGYQQFMENSMIVQNNVVNYPYGNNHTSLMEKIIVQKNINDYQNERILLKFQREAEEFKKSKSKHLKNLQSVVLSTKDFAESQYGENQEISRIRLKDIDVSATATNSQAMFLNAKKIFGESPKLTRESTHNFIPSRGRTIQTDLQPTRQASLNQSKYKSQMSEEDLRFRETSRKSIESPDSPRVSLSIKQRTTKNLLPITDQGEDGLKLIRKNLFERKKLRIKCNNKYPARRNTTTTTIQESDQQNERRDSSNNIDEIKEVIQDISDIIKSNRTYVSKLHRRVKTNPNLHQDPEESYSPASKSRNKIQLKEIEKRQDPEKDPKINTPILKLNLTRFKKKLPGSPETLQKSRNKLMELSQIFE